MSARESGGAPAVPRLMTADEWNGRDWRVDGPVALRVAPQTWASAIGEVSTARKRPPPGTVGLTPVPDPFGGVSVFPICFSDDPDLICYPSYVRGTPTGREYGPCRCRRTRPDVPEIDLPGRPVQLACQLQWDGRSRPTCVNAGCRGGRGCVLVRLPVRLAHWPGGRRLYALVCDCRR
jgi:hypothetical protein